MKKTTILSQGHAKQLQLHAQQRNKLTGTLGIWNIRSML